MWRCETVEACENAKNLENNVRFNADPVELLQDGRDLVS